MENTTLTLKLSRQIILIIILIGLIGFFSGVFVGLLPCQHCEKSVLQIGRYKVLVNTVSIVHCVIDSKTIFVRDETHNFSLH